MFDDIRLEFERLNSQQVRIVVYNRADDSLLHIAQVNPAVPKRLDEFVEALRDKGIDVGDEAAQAGLKQHVQMEALNTLRNERPAAPTVRDYLAEMDSTIVQEAQKALQGPILRTVIEDARAIGIAGEDKLLTTIYLIGTSRLLTQPLAGCVNSPTSVGKSFIIYRIAEMFPTEAKIVTTKFSGNAIFYEPEGAFRHRFVVAGEQSLVNGEQELLVKQTLRELLSEGRVSKRVPVKKGGEFHTITFEADGPISYVDTTTKIDIFAEDANRTIVLRADESDEQTRRVLAKEADGAVNPTKARDETCPEIAKHWAIQRLLKPHLVSVPYAHAIASSLTCRNVEIRRAAPLLFGCIQASALLHQFQRHVNEHGYLEANLTDYRVSLALLSDWLHEAIGGHLTGTNQEFLGWLRSTFNGKSFTVADCVRAGKTKGQATWQLKKLAEDGAVTIAEHGRSTTGHKYRIVQDGVVQTELGLPSVQDIERTLHS